MPGVAAQVKVVFQADTASYTASVKAAKQQLGVFQTGAQGAGATARKEMTEARGAVAVLGEEIGIHLPRHVQRFVAGLPGVTSAMNAAFNSIAVIAIGAAIFEAGKKVYEFVEKNEEAARRNAAAWQDIARPMQQTNDELQLANDKIENAIARLEHKPENGMKEAIDEAIVSADTLGSKLAADGEKIANLLKTQQVSWSQRFVGDEGTDDLSVRSRSLQDNLNDIDVKGREKLNALRAQGGTDEQLATLTKELNAKRKAALDAEVQWANNELATSRVNQQKSQIRNPALAPELGVAPEPLVRDQTKRIGLLTSYAADLGRSSDFVGLTQQHAADLAQQKPLDAAAKAAADAQKQASEAMERNHRALDAMKADHQVSYDEEAAYWQKIADGVKRGSAVYNAALDEANKARSAGWKQYESGLFQGWMSDVRRHDERNPMLKAASPDVLSETWVTLEKQSEESTKRMQEYAVEGFRATAEAIKVVERQEEESIRLLFESGRISGHEAALRTQAAHAEGFAAWAGAARDFNEQNPMVPTPNGAETVAGYEMQAQRDSADAKATAALGSFAERIRLVDQQFTNLGDHMSNFTLRTLESFNETLLRTLSTPASFMRGQHPWRNLGSTVAQQAGGSALQYAEGSFMKSVPGLEKLFGKAPKGTSADLLHVSVDRMMAAGGLASSTASAIGGVTGKVGNAVSAAMSLFHIPGFAEGGMIPSNMPAMVGENGPELLMPVGHPRQVVPNGDFGMGGIVISPNIDARGAHDPAATEAAVNRALARHMPAIVQAARGYGRSENSRLPSKSRS